MIFYALMSVVIIIVSYILYKANKNTRRVIINQINVEHPDWNEQSSETTHLNVLHLSDIHLENLSISPQDLYHHVKNEKIDLIALTGDFLDRKRSIPKLIPYLKVLQNLDAKYGMYAVFGNHDYVLKGKNFDTLKETL